MATTFLPSRGSSLLELSVSPSPFFMERNRDIQKLRSRLVKPRPATRQSVAAYPPTGSIPFTTVSKRFPDDRAFRATTQEQELRKFLFKAENIDDEISGSLLKRTIKVDSKRISQPTSPIISPRKLQVLKSAARSIANIQDIDPESFRRDISSQCNISRSSCVSRSLINGMSTVPSRETVQTAPSSPRSTHKRCMFSSPTVAGFGEKATFVITESFLVNQINKWQTKKKQKESQNQRIQQNIVQRLIQSSEEKFNNPPDVATKFIHELKLQDQLLNNYHLQFRDEKQRYTERLQQLHLTKYKMFQFHTTVRAV